MSGKKNIPRHVALIMDGNRRWARGKNLPDIEGHRRGADIIEPIILRAIDLGIEVITFWAFSTKNFKRDKGFLKDIMTVFRETLKRRETFEKLKKNGGRWNVIGNPKSFPEDIVRLFKNYLKMDAKP